MGPKSRDPNKKNTKTRQTLLLILIQQRETQKTLIVLVALTLARVPAGVCERILDYYLLGFLI
jgi:hypothetical protein